MLSDERFERIMGFLKFYTRLVKAKEKKNLSETGKLAEEIENTPNTLEKYWLLRKTGELLN